MSWDLRTRYNFDATEAQIPEGQVSVYGFANAPANCVPASFTAALDLAGYPDIDPQQITDDLYGANYRGGYGTFDKCLGWIAAHVPNAPTWTHTFQPIDFAAIDRAGTAGQLIVFAGFIHPLNATFIPGPP